MESVTILNAIGQIDDKMIESAVIQVSQRKSSYRMTVFRRVVAIAACLTLVIGLLFAISALQRFGLHGGPDGPVIGIIGTQGSEPTQGDKPTHGTEATQGTEPTHGNDNKDFVTVDSVMMDLMSHYAMSCTFPVEYGTEDGYIPITVSFGLSQYCELDSVYFEHFPEILLQAGNYDDETIITLSRMNTEEITQPEYKVEYLWDDDRMWVIGFIFTHKETIQLPLELFPGNSGCIWIGISEHSSDGSLGSGAHVVLAYTRTEDSITFTVAQAGV